MWHIEPKLAWILIGSEAVIIVCILSIYVAVLYRLTETERLMDERKKDTDELAAEQERRIKESTRALKLADDQLQVMESHLKNMRTQLDNLTEEANSPVNPSVKAGEIQKGFYEEYVRIQRETSDLFKFLTEHYSDELKEGQLQNLPILRLVQVLLLRFKVFKEKAKR